MVSRVHHTARRRAVLVALVSLAAGMVISAPMSARGPSSRSAPAERTVAEFLQALSLHDTASFERLSIPHPRAKQLLMVGEMTPEARAHAERNLENLQLHSRDDFTLRGKAVDPDARGDYPIGSIGHFIAAANGGHRSSRWCTSRPDGRSICVGGSRWRR